MKQILLLMLLPLTLLCGIAYASDAYFVRFRAEGHRTIAGADVIWGDDILFYNTSTAPAVVRFLGVSNGTPQPDIPTLTLPPGQPIFLNPTPVAARWPPIPVPSMWVLHLDTPDGVLAESRAQYGVTTRIPEIGLSAIALG